jgi:hypothetical protein
MAGPGGAPSFCKFLSGRIGDYQSVTREKTWKIKPRHPDNQRPFHACVKTNFHKIESDPSFARAEHFHSQSFIDDAPQARRLRRWPAGPSLGKLWE